MIETRNLTIEVGEFILRDVNIKLPSLAYSVLMGKTGSGKTTLLEAMCGLKKIVSGQVLFDGRDVTHLKPAERGIGLVPQDGTLFSSMRVIDHLAFALRVRRLKESTIQRKVIRMSQLLQIRHLLRRLPHQLSGGERQRVALGRALSFEPKILCLDEPLSALDDDTRGGMIRLLKHVQQETGVTALHVTHNRSEAEALADVRLFIEGGVVEQHGAHQPQAERELEEVRK